MSSYESHALFTLMRDYQTDFQFLLNLNLRIAEQYPELLKNGFCQDREKARKLRISFAKDIPPYSDEEMGWLPSDIVTAINQRVHCKFKPYLFVVGSRAIDPATFVPIIELWTLIETLV